MANVSINIPDSIVPRVRTAGRATFPQYELLTDVQFFKTVTADYWKQIIAKYEQTDVERIYFLEHQTVVSDAYNKAIIDSAGIV